MPSQKTKTSRSAPTTSGRSTKRQRIACASSQFGDDVKKCPVALDALPWSEVEMPDMFVDAEGFFGLEEVEGFEVFRDGGKVQFLSKEVLANGFEDDFEGFSNEDITAAIKASHTPAPQTTNHIKSKTEKIKGPEEKSKNKSKQAQGASTQYEGNIFKALGDSAAVEEIDLSAWHKLNLAPQTLSAIAKLEFLEPTPIQRSAIPEILNGHDVIGKASTGSGKTLAFTIPILERWLLDHHDTESKTNIPTALVLSPTRELAHQLTNHIKALCAGLPDAPYVATITGGLSVQKQKRQLDRADIIIGTPGRIWEFISSSVEVSKALKQIEFLVVDEADRLLTEGHFKEVEDILKSLDHLVQGSDTENIVPTRQTLVFSATFDKDLQQKLAGKGKQGLLNNKSMEYLLKKLNFREETPKFIDVNPTSQMAEGLKEGMVECAGTEKDLYLYALLLHHPNQRTLIFTNSIHSVRRLVPFLQNLSLPALPLHSQMPQKARLRSIERFSSPSPTASSILVATDIAARGLDISSINLIIHYHLPRTADTYVHRSGRTARASALGTSILLCAPEEVVPMRRLVAKVHAQTAIDGAISTTKSKYLRSIDLDRKVVARLKSRVVLAKRIADAALAKEKTGHDDDWVRSAAEELGVDYNSEEFDAADGGKKGRGTGRKQRERELKSLSKAEVGQFRAELKRLMSQKINVGVSERYLTSGGLDINLLLRERGGDFLGAVGGIGLED